MNKKLFGFIFMFLLATTLVSASSFAFELGFITQQQGDCFNIYQPCDNCSYMNITILYPNGTTIIENEAMTNLSSAYYYNYTFCDTNTTGVYPLIINYDDMGYLVSETDYFQITATGEEPPGDFTLSLMILLFFVLFVGTIIVLLKGFEKGVNMEMDLGDWIKSFTAFGVYLLYYWFAFNYWGDIFIMDLLETFLWVVGFMSLFVSTVFLIMSIIKRIRDRI